MFTSEAIVSSSGAPERLDKADKNVCQEQTRVTRIMGENSPKFWKKKPKQWPNQRCQNIFFKAKFGCTKTSSSTPF
jgi:hypothetical protein